MSSIKNEQNPMYKQAFSESVPWTMLQSFIVDHCDFSLEKVHQKSRERDIEYAPTYHVLSLQKTWETKAEYFSLKLGSSTNNIRITSNQRAGM
jgi:hypothetical protein